MAERLTLTHIFIDHSNMWGGARLASRVRTPKIDDERARISVRTLDVLLGGKRQGVSTKVVSGGVPPGMEGLWSEYETHRYDTQRLFRDKQWKEHGVDHTIIGHMWRLLALYRDAPTRLVLASGDGKRNEFGTSFYEVLEEVLKHDAYSTWSIELASFDWRCPEDAPIRGPTNTRMRQLVEGSPRGKFINLMDAYPRLVFHQK
jgi:hypothetical protein